MTPAIEQWQDQRAEHFAQRERAIQGLAGTPGAGAQVMAALFDTGPAPAEDPLLALLAPILRPDMTVLDIGAGGGRYALPLAREVSRVTAVEPNPKLAASLRRHAADDNLPNLHVMEQSWEDATAEPADLTLCAHVVYGVADITLFIEKLRTHATERVAIVAHMEGPLAFLAPFWEAVHGEPFVNLPAAPELVRVLWSLDVYPDVTMLPAAEVESVPTRAMAEELLRFLLCVDPDTRADASLRSAMEAHIVEDARGVTMRVPRPRRPALISWRR